MPSIVNHYLMAEQSLNSMKDNELKKSIEQHYQLYAFASNGPDLFFYYNVYPWMNQKEAKKIANIGNQLHSSQINAFFDCVLDREELRNNPAKLTYLAGLLCHWVLDMKCHPYIFYFSQTDDNHSAYYHRNMESNLDALMLKRIKQQTVKDFKVYSIVAFDQADIKTIYQFYDQALQKVYNITIDEKIIDNCMHMFYSLQKHLYDKTGIKNTISEWFEKVTNIKSQPLSMIVPINYQDQSDLLNLQHLQWHHPVTGEISTKSFVELYDEAVELAQYLLTLLNDFVYGTEDKQSILKVIDDRAYDTGKHFKNSMKYFGYQFSNSKN